MSEFVVNSASIVSRQDGGGGGKGARWSGMAGKERVRGSEQESVVRTEVSLHSTFIYSIRLIYRLPVLRHSTLPLTSHHTQSLLLFYTCFSFLTSMPERVGSLHDLDVGLEIIHGHYKDESPV